MAHAKISPEEHLHNLRHSLAHVLATAIGRLYNDVKFGTGPVTENGFFYDIDMPERLAPEDLKRIEKEMRKIIRADYEMIRTELSISDAKEKFLELGQPYKVELIEDLAQAGTETVSLYTTGEFTDLCRGGHVERTSEIPEDCFSLTRIAGAYWKSDEQKQQLQRISGIAFETKDALDAYEKMLKEAEKRDHKKLGKELDLFYIDEMVGKGLPLWTPKGTVIKHLLIDYTRNIEKKYGYDHVETPFMGNEKLYKTSGHLDHYQNNMYAPIDMDGEKFYLRPMACPHHIRLLQRHPVSYRDLPVRYAEVADYSRFEKSGELMGMIRVRKFQLTDAHIFVAPEQAKEEFKKVCALIQEAMTGLGMQDSITYRFSKRDPKNSVKYYPDDALWNHAESLMKEALDEMKLDYVEAEDEAAFYGPKLDVQGRNVNGKEDTLFTAQFDFLLPEKFDITYTDKDGSEKRPIMIHRSAIGSLERTFAFLIEHYAGAFPLWLSPVQVAVLPISEKFAEYADTVVRTLKEKNIRVELKGENESLGKRIRECQKQKIPAMLILGEKEVSDKTVTLRRRDLENQETMTIDTLLEALEKEIREKK